ncbi:unnamed protein product, partial [Mesorhabditis belari]|uniref:Secreted protein n=1 Tax=Mesorhabditis belari TaxID=2138241 RepID=A0AAF3J687_9BILA
MYRILGLVFALTLFYGTTGILKACARCGPKTPTVIMTGQYVTAFSQNVIVKQANGCVRKNLLCRSNVPQTSRLDYVQQRKLGKYSKYDVHSRSIDLLESIEMDIHSQRRHRCHQLDHVPGKLHRSWIMSS